MLKKYDVITIGSAFQDVYVLSKRFRIVRDAKAITGESECFAFGTKIELDDILFEIGGGATNSAYTIRRQGLRVGCVTRIGNDGAAHEVKKFFKQARIGDLSVVDTKKRTAHSVVFLGKGGERTILVYRGAAHTFKSNDIKFPTLNKARWLYITSLAGNITLLKRIVQHAKKNGVQVAINPGKLEIRKSREKMNTILRATDIVLLNREEASMITENQRGGIVQILKKLDDITPGVVLVTDGSKGSYAVLNHIMYRVIITPVSAVDMTGAGDAFGSGFLAGYIRSKRDVRKALTLATYNAASVVTKIGAKHGLLSKKSALPKIRFKITTRQI